MQPIGITLCSGIGAPEIAAPWVDWRLASEIEKFPRAVLQERLGYKTLEDHNQGDPLLWGDMTEVTPELMRRRGVPIPDLVVAGTPCQAFSVAGARRGLKDARGNLTLKFVEICHDIVAARHDRRLAVLWENVPGVLSDKDNAFGCFLGGLVGADDALFPCARPHVGRSNEFWKWIKAGKTEIEDDEGNPTGEFEIVDAHHRCRWPGAGMVAGPLARASWRVCDAQYFGVAQRRRRVFLVIDFGGAIDPAAVLFERQSLQGHSAPRREKGQNPAPTISARTKGGGGLGTDFDLDGGLITSTGEVSHCLNAGGMGRQDFETETETVIAHALRGEGFDASEDGTGRGTPIVPIAGTICKDSFAGGAGGRPEGAAAGHFIPVAFDCKAGGNTGFAVGETPSALRGEGHGGGHTAIAIQERAISENPDTGPNGAGVRDDDTAFTLEARQVPQAVAFDMRGREGGAMPEGPHDTANIRAASGGSSRSYVAEQWAVRRLTPLECSRLQGFADDHTAITYNGKPAADGPQYKALGNSMAVPCIKWIMDRMRISMTAERRFDAS